jgi:predicted amidophosphoribosyltransferase
MDEKWYLQCSGKCKIMGGTFNKGDVHCWQCGSPLEKWVKECPNCQLNQCQSNRYCVRCGTELVERKIPWQEAK